MIKKNHLLLIIFTVGWILFLPMNAFLIISPLISSRDPTVPPPAPWEHME